MLSKSYSLVPHKIWCRLLRSSVSLDYLTIIAHIIRINIKVLSYLKASRNVSHTVCQEPTITKEFLTKKHCSITLIHDKFVKQLYSLFWRSFNTSTNNYNPQNNIQKNSKTLPNHHSKTLPEQSHCRKKYITSSNKTIKSSRFCMTLVINARGPTTPSQRYNSTSDVSTQLMLLYSVRVESFPLSSSSFRCRPDPDDAAAAHVIPKLICG